MTDNEIIKVLECCRYQHGRCTSCPLYAEVTVCKEKKDNYVLDLVYRQKEEIERLEKEKDSKLVMCIANDKDKIRFEAIKDFADRLKEKFGIADCIVTIDNNDIDNLVKEMTEENEDESL